MGEETRMRKEVGRINRMTLKKLDNFRVPKGEAWRWRK